jgi:hypothetical protein
MKNTPARFQPWKRNKGTENDSLKHQGKRMLMILALSQMEEGIFVCRQGLI